MSPSTNSMENSTQKSTSSNHSLLVKTLDEFDRADIGERVPELASDLKNVKNILVTGGAGFM